MIHWIHRALVIEDQSQYSEDLTDLLEKLDYEVMVAENKTKAELLLKQHLFDLVIIDINLDEKDEENEDGLIIYRWLAGPPENRPQNPNLIVNSETEVLRRILEALGGSKLYTNAVLREGNYIDHTWWIIRSPGYISRLTKIIQKLPANNIDKPVIQPDNFFEVAVIALSKKIEELVQKGEVSNEHEFLKDLTSEQITDRVHDELTNLLAKMFQHDDKIILKSISPGMSGASVVKVTPIKGNVPRKTSIIKFGYKKDIEQEIRNYRQYVVDIVKHYPNVPDASETNILQGIQYENVPYKSFREFYHTAELAELQTMLDDLASSLDSWYANVEADFFEFDQNYRQFLNLNFREESRPGNRLFSALDKLNIAFPQLIINKESIIFPLPLRDQYVNPFWSLTHQEFLDSLSDVAPIAPTHGDFNANNIFIKRRARSEEIEAWLIDFGRTGIHHAARDFAQLETVVKFTLLLDEQATFEERVTLETLLTLGTEIMSAQALIDAYTAKYGHTPKLNQHTEKALHFICAMHAIVKTQFYKGHLADKALIQYLTAQLYFSIGTLKFMKSVRTNGTVSDLQALHALLASAMIVEKIDDLNRGLPD